jgi:hypothetical protein
MQVHSLSEHLWEYAIPWVGVLMEETSWVFTEMLGKVNLILTVLKRKSSNFLMMMQWSTSPSDDDTPITGVIPNNNKIEQEVLGRTDHLLSSIWHGPHWKRRVQQFFYCWVCIHYRGNVSTEPLPSNDRGIFTNPLPSNNRGIHIHTHTHTDGRHFLIIPLRWAHVPWYTYQVS